MKKYVFLFFSKKKLYRTDFYLSNLKLSTKRKVKCNTTNTKRALQKNLKLFAYHAISTFLSDTNVFQRSGF